MNDLAQLHFAEPGWLWLAAAGPVLAVALMSYASRARRQQLAGLVATSALAGLTRSHSPARRFLKNALLVLALAGMGVALARPQWGIIDMASERTGEDIVFAIDCSRSMLATDVSPSRLERAKLAVSDFARRYARGRVGLIAFSGQGFLQCPLTYDYDAFQEALEQLDARSIPVPGTDIGSALNEAYHALESKSGRKVIVLLTDGEDLEEKGVARAQELADQDVVVFTIGVGTATGAEIRVLDERGQLEVIRDRQGAEVHSRLDSRTLQRIAEASRGDYFALGAIGEGFARLQFALKRDAAAQPKLRTMGVDRFHVPLAVVLGLVIMESMLSTRRRKGGKS